MPASTYLGNALLNQTLRGIAFVPPTRVYVSLHTGDPGLTGANEVTTTQWPSYARRDAAAGGAVGTGFTAASAKSSANAFDLFWPPNDSANPVTVSHFALWDAVVAGNCLYCDELTAPRTFDPSDEGVVHGGALLIGIT